tara:strand:+ start:53 stop:454 length:402 start_codon:yes stop_codon:yes gene_type:complete
MPYKNPEVQKEYMKQYRSNNKERKEIYMKEYRIINKKRISDYYINNHDSLNEKGREYYECGKGKILGWKRRGLVSDNYELILERYTNSKNCEECNCEYSKYGDGVGKFKCMDHSHESGEFRNILCHPCNLKRR